MMNPELERGMRRRSHGADGIRASQVVASLLLAALAAARASGADWPMWRYDAGRTASSPHGLPAELHLQWVREYPRRTQVWENPLNQDLMPYDRAFEPVVLGKTLFLGFNDGDKLVAFDTETGAERWAFHADGPVRLPPAAWKGKVYFSSDDGYLYCLNARDGKLLWKVRGGPADRRILGNSRLISTWPARGGPVVSDGVVYFAAGIWPFMGTFLYALDAETGSVVWSNTGNGARYMLQPHKSPSFAGVGPQGSLVLAGERLLAPGGRSVPACFDLRTGGFRYYDLVANGKTGGSFVCAVGDAFFCHHREKVTHMYDLAGGKVLIGGIGRYPVLTEDAYYMSGRPVVAFDAKRKTTYKDKKGNLRAKVPRLWEFSADASGDLIKAGSRLYAAGAGAVTALELRGPNAGPQVAWKKTVEGKVERLVAADGKLFAVTLEGAIHCFGARGGTPRRYAHSPKVLPKRTDTWSSLASSVLKAAGASEGYCLVLGLRTGRLVEELVRRSELHVIAVDPDAARVARLRRRLDEAGLYGTRAAVHVGDPLTFEFPPYLASPIVSEDLTRAGVGKGKAFVEAVFRPLRPYGGAACLSMSASQGSRFAASVRQAKLAGAKVERKGRLTLLVRNGPLPGSASWTHQYGDVANTVKSNDELVRLPLGMLWFGGSSNMDVLPRHGHGPPEQVIGGRLFIEGIDCLSARDVYTGRVLWKRTFEKLGTFGFYYDRSYSNRPTSTSYNQGHIPGANARGTNYVAAIDKVYLAVGGECLVLDPATGETTATFSLPAEAGAKRPAWGYIGVYEDLLIAGSNFVRFSEKYGVVKKKVSDITSSERLVVMDRHTGKVLWTRDAKHAFRHNAVAVGAGKIFCIDGLPPPVMEALERRGEARESNPALLALDVRTGRLVWEKTQDVFGTWLGYSKEHDVLLQAGSRAGDRAPDEVKRGMVAYRGRDGTVVWKDLGFGYSGPAMLHHGTVITQRKMIDLLTGKRQRRKHPLTGETIERRWNRNYGCNTAIASEHLLTFRSAAAGFFDLTNDGGTGNFGGFKSGCTSNLVAADGVLNAPEYTRTCSCAYQNQTSLALIHMPEVEMWTFNKIDWTGRPVRRLGINLGAPGDRMAKDGTLWLDHPSVGGPSPKVPVEIRLEEVSWFRRHSSLVKGSELRWVAASGARGISSLRVNLGRGPARSYTVRLVFAEPEKLKPGERIFSVAVQGRPALPNFDVARAARGADTVVTREFKGVTVKDWLEITLKPSRPGGRPPVLSGVEATAAGW